MSNTNKFSIISIDDESNKVMVESNGDKFPVALHCDDQGYWFIYNQNLEVQYVTAKDLDEKPKSTEESRLEKPVVKAKKTKIVDSRFYYKFTVEAFYGAQEYCETRTYFPTVYATSYEYAMNAINRRYKSIVDGGVSLEDSSDPDMIGY
jgi:hypothetical protein